MELQYNHIKKEYDQILEKLSSTTDSRELATLGRRQAELLPMVENINRLEKVKTEIAEHEKMIADNSELAEMAASELPDLQAEREKLVEELRVAMLPKDPYDEKNTIIEIRSGAGGDEAGVFAAELFRMYSKYAEKLKYKVVVLSSSRSSIGGFKEVIFEIIVAPLAGRASPVSNGRGP